MFGKIFELLLAMAPGVRAGKQSKKTMHFYVIFGVAHRATTSLPFGVDGSTVQGLEEESQLLDTTNESMY